MGFEKRRLLKKAQNYKCLVLCGAGKNGVELFDEIFKECNIVAFFDNDDKLQASGEYGGVSITKPRKINDALYVVTVGERYRQAIFDQLKELGIRSIDIYIYYAFFEYECVKNADLIEYEEIIKEQYKYYLGKELQLEKQETYNEIINWEKLNVSSPIRTELADKVKVRNWVKNKIGDEYLNKIYGVWKSSEEIDFDCLPDSYVLKVNNGSARNIIVKNKTQLDISSAKKQIDYWIEHNYAYNDLELHYRDIQPLVFAEKYLDGVAESVYEYDVFCFHGKPRYIWCIKGSHLPHCRASFYDLEWKMQPFSYGYPKDEEVAPKPLGLDEMIEKTSILAKEFKHVRVDWFLLPNGELYFGEMTFSTWGGYMPFVPDEMDLLFGKMITGEK